VAGGRSRLARPIQLRAPPLFSTSGRRFWTASDTFATVFFFCGIMFQYNVLLYNICMEKDLQLRRGLRMIGLKDSVYWLSWLISALAICTLACLILIATGPSVRPARGMGRQRGS